MTDGSSPEVLRHLTGWPFDRKRTRLGVAVSGGGDSLALLDLMAWHGAAQGFTVHAVTVDHGLRPEADSEAQSVAEHCAQRGIDHQILTWAWDGTGNVQAAAREARYALMAGWAKAKKIGMIALGHTEDDVAETFLMRLARSSGVDGLSAMERRFERNGITWIRPMVSIGRAELRAYLKQQRITWTEDPSNDDGRFERVTARKALAAMAPLGISANILASVAKNLAVTRAALESYVFEVAKTDVEEDRGDVILPSDIIDKGHVLPVDVRFRLRRAALQFVSGSAYPPRTDALLNLEFALIQSRRHTLNGCVITKVDDGASSLKRWRITREYNAVQDSVCATDMLWDTRWRLDGPRAPDLEIRALGDAVSQCPDWRASGLPRESLRASPSIWRGETLIAAPLAGFCNGWTATLTPTRAEFTAFLIGR